ncbi:D-alanine--D-alanine ligase family protein [Phyllobacterium pellucidum]|uniref:D-alanine--D-alanine ligase family protein n=1 Tax=Phyllobacterium pellucidum TaxID=2740464 RepID=UPI001D156466|nr:D-alanine--D-alanine ligase family protein [Phyllobacterium sp. T1018]UGY08134.1 D-alanine--D-alanine ligase [Phyllobacterium sp. T1018]
MSRTRVAILFGGRSSEHDVSVMSARNVFEAIDPEVYETVLVAVTRQGEWLLVDGGFPQSVPGDGTKITLLPGGRGRALALPISGPAYEITPIDVLLPVLHGPFGEDGSVQGLAEVANIPYVGSGIFGSAAAMDKYQAKCLLAHDGLPVASGIMVKRSSDIDLDAFSQTLSWPVFVKPARQGSSVGVSKARTAEELHVAVGSALQFDDHVLIEEFIEGREIELGVLEAGDSTLIVSVPGEIAPSNTHDFYTYEAKYLDADGADLTVPARISPDETQALQDMAEQAFRALGCEGMARVDFFLRADGSAVINEVNTIPGFTNISMYPKVLGATGIPYPELIHRLIQHGLKRAVR